ncbi:MAG: 1-acyl-sn-glycerol-3-phosphate acyltransferase [Saprospiraceae bacterium]|nr:1-acyl-sn-glycerol-3-phosphate acyltransferase [Saprospiraceae bacterium]
MMQRISLWLAKLWGFRFTGAIDHIPRRVMFVVMPHTSNWDFPLGLITRGALKLKLRFIAKNSLFKWPYGFIFRWLGGIPVDRSKSQNFVHNVVKSIEKYDDISLAMSPEGTRKRTDKLKSGFYWIAMEAKMPLVMVKFDFGNKEVNFSEPMVPVGDYEADLSKIVAHFKGVKGYNPEQGYLFET